jgi:hypothetical protein
MKFRKDVDEGDYFTTPYRTLASMVLLWEVCEEPGSAVYQKLGSLKEPCVEVFQDEVLTRDSKLKQIPVVTLGVPKYYDADFTLCEAGAAVYWSGEYQEIKENVMLPVLFQRMSECHTALLSPFVVWAYQGCEIDPPKAKTSMPGLDLAEEATPLSESTSS